MNERSKNIQAEIEAKAKFRNLQGERGKIDDMSIYQGVRRVMSQAEINALQTDYAQDGLLIDEHFWRVTLASIRDQLCSHDCKIEIRNWFALQGIFG